MWNNTMKMSQLNKDNKGFTLVELIIVMAISSILMASISIFLFTGSQYFQLAKSEVDVQSEAQAVMNQVKDRVLECNNLDDYDASSNQFVLYSISEIQNPSGTGVVSQIDKKEIFWLDTTEGKLYYRALKGADIAGVSVPFPNASKNKYLLAEYITGIDVIRTDNIVTVQISLEQGGRAYTVKDTIKLRNRVIEKPGAGAS